jgi:hypothetical protein
MIALREAEIERKEKALIIAERRQIRDALWTTNMSDDYLMWYTDEEFNERIEFERERKLQLEKEAKEKAENEIREREESDRKKKEDEERKIIEDEKKLKSQTLYQDWLKQHKYNENTHLIKDENWKKIMYEKIAEFLLPISN